MTRGDDRPDDALKAAVSDLAERAGFDCEDVTVRLAGSRRLIRVVVDRDGGVGLDAAAALSRDLSSALDTEYDALLGERPYTLEVTSRGVGAPLTAERHFRRAVGRAVTIVRADGASLAARIARVDGGRIVVLTGRDGVQPLTIPLADIRAAAVQPEFSPPSARVVAALHDVAAAEGEEVGEEDAEGKGEDAR
jgi:ribosome maturation factor RimP